MSCKFLAFSYLYCLLWSCEHLGGKLRFAYLHVSKCPRLTQGITLNCTAWSQIVHVVTFAMDEGNACSLVKSALVALLCRIFLAWIQTYINRKQYIRVRTLILCSSFRRGSDLTLEDSEDSHLSRSPACDNIVHLFSKPKNCMTLYKSRWWERKFPFCWRCVSK